MHYGLKRLSVLGIFLCCWLCSSFSVASTSTDSRLSSIAQLQIDIEALQARHQIAGLAVSVVDPNHPDGAWLLTNGWADKENHRKVTEDTLFRVGSVSKMLVSLSVLSLVEQNKLTLDTPVRVIAPDLVFANPWRKTHPLRVVHLLNHASGWDAPHFIENAVQENAPLTIGQALAVYPQSRVSRWPPGTRTAYNNTGPLAAAYIVEQITQMPFEAYVKQTFLAPLGMTDSDYFYNESYRNKGVSLYNGATKLPYRDFSNRPSGGLNSNAKDMLALLQFFLRQKTLASVSHGQLVQMETVQGTLAAESGLAFGNGLGNMPYQVNGWVFHGHEGSVRGGTAMLVYQPELQAGYVIMANGEGPLVAKLHRLLAEYLSKDSKAALTIAEQAFSDLHQSQAGLYRLVSPIKDQIAPFIGLLPWRLQVSAASASIKPAGAAPRALLADENGHFAQAETGLRVLIGTLDPLDGKVMHYGPNTLKKISAFSAYFPLVVSALWLFFSVATLLRWLLHTIRRTELPRIEQLIARGPRLAALSMLVCLISLYFILGSNDPYSGSSPGLLSVLVMLTSGGFVLCVVLGVYDIVQHRNANRSVFKQGYSVMQSVVNSFVAVFMLLNGLVGLTLWA